MLQPLLGSSGFSMMVSIALSSTRSACTHHTGHVNAAIQSLNQAYVGLFRLQCMIPERRKEQRYLHGEKALQALAMEVALEANHQSDSPLCHLAGVEVAGVLKPAVLFLFFLQKHMHDTLSCMQTHIGNDQTGMN